jgi:hypothetical protein
MVRRMNKALWINKVRRMSQELGGFVHAGGRSCNQVTAQR